MKDKNCLSYQEIIDYCKNISDPNKKETAEEAMERLVIEMHYDICERCGTLVNEAYKREFCNVKSTVEDDRSFEQFYNDFTRTEEVTSIGEIVWEDNNYTISNKLLTDEIKEIFSNIGKKTEKLFSIGLWPELASVYRGDNNECLETDKAEKETNIQVRVRKNEDNKSLAIDIKINDDIDGNIMLERQGVKYETEATKNRSGKYVYKFTDIPADGDVKILYSANK